MSYRRLLGLLPDRSGIMLLAIALATAVALLGLGSLVISKGEALAEQHQARQQLEAMRAQNRRLVNALERDQNGENIVPRAYQLFDRTPPGLTIIEGEFDEGDDSSQPSAELPMWVQLLEQIKQSLTNLRIRLE